MYGLAHTLKVIRCLHNYLLLQEVDRTLAWSRDNRIPAWWYFSIFFFKLYRQIKNRFFFEKRRKKSIRVFTQNVYSFVNILPGRLLVFTMLIEFCRLRPPMRQPFSPRALLFLAKTPDQTIFDKSSRGPPRHDLEKTWRIPRVRNLHVFSRNNSRQCAQSVYLNEYLNYFDSSRILRSKPKH